MVKPPTGPLNGALMAMPKAGALAPHHSTPTSTHDDTCSYTSQRDLMGAAHRSKNNYATGKLHQFRRALVLFVGPTSPKQPTAWRRTQLPSHPRNPTNERLAQLLVHAPTTHNSSDSTGREGGRVTMERSLSRVDLRIYGVHSKILGVQSTQPDCNLTLPKLIS